MKINKWIPVVLAINLAMLGVAIYVWGCINIEQALWHPKLRLLIFYIGSKLQNAWFIR